MEENLDVAGEIEVDESICVICGGSTYVGETISCETCMLWFHFQCVGVTHADDCVQSEDVPYYCPTCDLKIKKEIRLKMTREKPAAVAKQAKPGRARKKGAAVTTKSAGRSGKQDYGIKLKISINRTDTEADSCTKVGRQKASSSNKRNYREPRENVPAALDNSDDSLDGRPLVIDEIFPRAVKVGRVRRSSQRLGGRGEMEDHGPVEDLPCLDGRLSALPPADPPPALNNSHHHEEALGAYDLVWPDRFDRKSDGDDLMDVRDEEEMWLAALEEGNLARLESVDSELRSVRDPQLKTARQRALSRDNQDITAHLSLDYGTKKKTETVEDPAEKAIKAKKRKEIESEKKEKIKKKTLDTLLKKKDSRAAKQLKTFKSNREDVALVVYRQSCSSASLSLPAGCSYPLAAQPPRDPPKPVVCGVCGAANKKYSCSTTGTPLCSLACYKKNLASQPG